MAKTLRHGRGFHKRPGVCTIVHQLVIIMNYFLEDRCALLYSVVAFFDVFKRLVGGPNLCMICD